MSVNYRGLYALLTLSSVLLAMGIFLPCMTIEPGYGEFTSLVSILKPEFGKAKEISIIGGILALWNDEFYFLSLIILVFSVLFPIGKLCLLWNAVDGLRNGLNSTNRLSQIEKLAKFSMLDVFVLALIIVSLKALPGGTLIELNWGILAFSIAVIASIKIPSFILQKSTRLKTKD